MRRLRCPCWSRSGFGPGERNHQQCLLLHYIVRVIVTGCGVSVVPSQIFGVVVAGGRVRTAISVFGGVVVCISSNLFEGGRDVGGCTRVVVFIVVCGRVGGFGCGVGVVDANVHSARFMFLVVGHLDPWTIVPFGVYGIVKTV